MIVEVPGGRPQREEKRMAEYLILIYEDESRWETADEAAFD